MTAKGPSSGVLRDFKQALRAVLPGDLVEKQAGPPVLQLPAPGAGHTPQQVQPALHPEDVAALRRVDDLANRAGAL